MRLTLAALLLLPVLPAASATAFTGDGADPGGHGPARVTAVVQDASGGLTFRRGRAADAVAGHALAGRWRREPGVLAADVDHRVHITGSADPLQPQQWGLTTLRATDVWAAGDATGQVVGVIDTGVDASHPDLAGTVLAGTDVLAPGGDGRTDPNGHGSHVAGIVAATAGNGVGGAGLAKGAKVLPVRVMAADGSGWDSDAAQGLTWAASHGATIVNLSFGGPDRSSVMDKAVQYALSKGVALVVASGNEGAAGDPVEWPAANPGVIAVGAVDAAGVRPSWSGSGAHLALTAPGVGILSTVPVTVGDHSGYATWSGTSMAAPFVTAAAALLRRAQPGLTAAGVRRALMDTADDLGPIGFDTSYGAGRLNVFAAAGLVTAAAPAATATQILPTSTPTVTEPAPVPVLTARISASRSTTPYAGAVTVSGRVLVDGLGEPGIAMRLERLVGTSWLLTRTGTSGSGGLASWLLHPDRTAYYRVVGPGWFSPQVRVVVTPVLTATARTTGVYGRFLPAGTTQVRIDVLRSTGWTALTTVTSAADGAYRLTRALRAGTYVRAVAGGVVSATTRAY